VLNCTEGWVLVVQDDAQQSRVDLKPAVIFDEPELSELVHEEIDARPRRPNHVCEQFLRELGEDRLRFVGHTVPCEQQKRASKPFLAGIEQLIDEIFFNADVAGQHERDEPICFFGK
jgi:hypothetical protein